MTKKTSNKGVLRNSCLGKIRHKSLLAAEYTLSKMRGKESHLLEIYPCKFCKSYHIGHNRKNGNPKNKSVEKGEKSESSI